MKLPIWLVAVSMLLAASRGLAQTGITSHRLGDNTGIDREPAILADGSHVQRLAALTRLPPTSIPQVQRACRSRVRASTRRVRTCIFNPPVMEERPGDRFPSRAVPFRATTSMPSLRLGANHRIYAGYMDGNTQYTPNRGDLLDDFGVTWSQPWT